MEDSKTYCWKKLAVNGSYIIDNSNAQNYPTSELSQNIFEMFSSYELSDFIKSFIKKHQTISIPSNISNLIDILVESNRLKEQKLEFYLVACVFSHFLGHFQ